MRAAPERADLRVALAAAYLQKVRETGDPAFYTRAERRAAPALARTRATPTSLDRGGDARARAPRLPRRARAGQRARARAAGLVDVSAVLVDALVELGRYGDAERELQRWSTRKPNLAAYARVSYLRELHGDLAGAVERDAARRRRRRAGAGERRLRAARCSASSSASAGDDARGAARVPRARWSPVPGLPAARRPGSRGSTPPRAGRDADRARCRRSSSGCRCPST